MNLFRHEPKPEPVWSIWEHDDAFWLIGPSGYVTGSPMTKERAEKSRDGLNRTLAARRAYEQVKHG